MKKTEKNLNDTMKIVTGYPDKDVKTLADQLAELDAANIFSHDNLGSAKLYATVFQNVSRFNTVKKRYMLYDSARWVDDREDMRALNNAKKLTDALKLYIDKAALSPEGKVEYLNYITRLARFQDRNAMIKDAKDINSFSSENMDINDYLLNCKNVTVDLSGNEPVILEHDPKMLLSKVCNAEYDPTAECPLWEQTIDQIMEGDKEKIRYIQKLLGTCLTGCTKEEELYIFFGSTSRNGKSTICETVLSLLGDYGTTISPETLALKNKDSRAASPDLAKLKGIRFVVCSEPPKRMLFDAGLVKNMTGREEIDARALYEDPISFLPKFKLVINTNYLPIIADDTLFQSERIRVISFDRHFSETEQNKDLKELLRKERNGILGWLVKGWVLYKQEGLAPVSAVRAATDAYRSDSDKIGTFISDCLVPSDRNIAAGDAYVKYTQWCQECGYGTESKRNFFADLKSRGIFTSSGTVEKRTVRNVIKGYYWANDGFEPMEPKAENPFLDPEAKYSQTELPLNGKAA